MPFCRAFSKKVYSFGKSQCSRLCRCRKSFIALWNHFHTQKQFQVVRRSFADIPFKLSSCLNLELLQSSYLKQPLQVQKIQTAILFLQIFKYFSNSYSLIYVLYRRKCNIMMLYIKILPSALLWAYLHD